MLGMLLLFCTLSLQQAFQPMPTPTPEAPLPTNRGVFELSAGGDAAIPTPYPTGITGVSCRDYWTNLNPSSGSYSFTTLDACISQAYGAGLKIVIDISSGTAPDWELEKLAALTPPGVYSMTWDKSFKPPNQLSAPVFICAPFEFPIPYNATFQADYDTFIQALATNIGEQAGAANVVRIEGAGVASTTDENYLPYYTASAAAAVTLVCNGTSSQCIGVGATPVQTSKGTEYVCNPSDYLDAWITAGYTPNKIISAFTTNVDNWNAAFPSAFIDAALITPSNAFPGINNSGQATGQASDSTLINSLISVMTAANFNAVIQNNGWNSFVEPSIKIQAGLIPTGYQESGALGANFPNDSVLLSPACAQWAEVYQADFTVGNAAALATLQSALVNAPCVPSQ